MDSQLHSLIKRTWPTTLLYIFFILGIPYVDSYLPQTIIYAISAVTTVFFASSIWSSVQTERHLSTLGSRAPAVRSWAPWGLDTLYRAVKAFSTWKNHEFWYWTFSFNRNPNHPYTVEEVTFGERIVFTADEENIKAVLASQFQDFGKGDQFRKEWKDFLGLSRSHPIANTSILLC
jgi:hypothetical protein